MMKHSLWMYCLPFVLREDRETRRPVWFFPGLRDTQRKRLLIELWRISVINVSNLSDSLTQHVF